MFNNEWFGEFIKYCNNLLETEYFKGLNKNVDLNINLFIRMQQKYIILRKHEPWESNPSFTGENITKLVINKKLNIEYLNELNKIFNI